METVEERPFISSTIEVVKSSTVEGNSVHVEETNVCQKSNGVDCEQKSDDQKVAETNDVEETNMVKNSSGEPKSAEQSPKKNDIQCESIQKADILKNTASTEVIETVTDNENDGKQEQSPVTEVVEVTTESVIEVVEKEPCNDNHVNNLETFVSEQVQFETEIVVEKNDNDVNDSLLIDNQENDSTGNILSELGPNIELKCFVHLIYLKIIIARSGKKFSIKRNCWISWKVMMSNRQLIKWLRYLR